MQRPELPRKPGGGLELGYPFAAVAAKERPSRDPGKRRSASPGTPRPEEEHRRVSERSRYGIKRGHARRVRDACVETSETSSKRGIREVN